MLIGLGDGGKGRGRGKKGCDGCGGLEREKRRATALRQLTAAHAAGALAGLGGLGDLTPGAWFALDRSSIDAETQSFDGRLNAWMTDYQAATATIPAPVIQQIDDFIGRWRALKDSWYFVGKTRADAIIAMEAEWNRFRDQVAGYAGKESAVAAATVTVDGKTVRADEIPPGTDTLSRVESMAKWAALLVGGVVAYKVASDLGVVAKIGGLLKGGSSAAAAGGGAGRRWGSARL